MRTSRPLHLLFSHLLLWNETSLQRFELRGHRNLKSEMPGLSTPQSGVKRSAEYNAGAEKTPTKRSRPITQPVTHKQSNKRTKSQSLDSSPSTSPASGVCSSSPYINSPSSTLTPYQFSPLRRIKAPPAPDTPARKLKQDAAVRGARAFVKAWTGPDNPHKMVEHYCSVLRRRGQPITLAEIWAFSKTEDGNPPGPKNTDLAATKPGASGAQCSWKQVGTTGRAIPGGRSTSVLIRSAPHL
ncbi:hypothetical protein B0T14DRAFT_223569 [Immersiella caudata]|uniref:Uncharacterized protein n=1 Tax=Immersiella caudata TaxID=314043 RepID=A0AA39WR57_9PEZI|nr:hypothetical protein B0T14DRAFT_223569 [Immersiella caudata]